MGVRESTLENLVANFDVFFNAYQGRRVFVTGHTGFKGSWLSEWLLLLGAEIHGYALDPEPGAVLFDQLELSRRLSSDTRADLADRGRLAKLVAEVKPDFVFHLGAQPLVRLSYRQPVDTFATNLMGTVHILEAVRLAASPSVTICVTTDKCYENDERVSGYSEDDPMGGHDPYSASKGCAELVVSSYRRSYFSGGGQIKVASARAGNVVGGGDWAEDRVIPDCIRALSKGVPVSIRNPGTTRPWQHVLEPLSGYLHLAARLATNPAPTGISNTDQSLCSAFNFGPLPGSKRTVRNVLEEVFLHWPGSWVMPGVADTVHEASRLSLCTDKATGLLGWVPVWSFEETIRRTVAAYRRLVAGELAASVLHSQISDYTNDAAKRKLPWCV